MGDNFGIYKDGDFIADLGRVHNYDADESDQELLVSKLIMDILAWSKVELTADNLHEMTEELYEMVEGFADEFVAIGRVWVLRLISKDAEIICDNGKKWG